ncbi:MAG: hypothetical protein ACR2QJ_02245 [Geminicoccaceae bacterium]
MPSVGGIGPYVGTLGKPINGTTNPNAANPVHAPSHIDSQADIKLQQDAFEQALAAAAAQHGQR